MSGRHAYTRRILGCCLGLLVIFPLAAVAADKLYELRIYTTNPGKLDALNTRFRDHTLKLFEKHGIENLYYWTVTEGAEGEDPANLLVYIVAHKDKASADAAWQAFLADPEWQKVARESEAGGAILAGRPYSLYLETVDIPTGETAAARADAGRIFELRKYNTGVDGLAGTIDRFQGGEAELFRKHGMETLHFWSALDQSSFVYLLAHKDRETARASWQGFFAEFRSFMEKYNAGRPAPPAGTPPPPRMTSEIRYLTPTDYSLLK
jgi:hypothetical protein